jgi:hypothetical protein
MDMSPYRDLFVAEACGGVIRSDKPDSKKG